MTIGATVLEGGALGPTAPDQIARVGDAIAYTVKVTNGDSSNCPVSGDTVTLTLPDGTMQTLATNQSFTPGQVQTYDENSPLYVVAQGDIGVDGSVLATAASNGTATEVSGQPEPVSANGQFEVAVIHPETTLTKSVDFMSGTVPLMVKYTFTETNVSPDTVPFEVALDSISDVVVSDTGTGACTVPATPDSGDTNSNGVLDVGEAWVFTCTNDYTVAGTYKDTATATGNAGDEREAGTTDSNGAPQDEQSNQVTVTGLTPPAINVVKSEPTPGDGKNVTPGSSTITYDLTVANTGQTAATGVTVIDPIPSGTTYVAGSASCGVVPNCTPGFASPNVTFDLSSVAAGASGLVLSFQVTVNSGDQPGTDITNQGYFTNVNTPSCNTSTGVQAPPPDGDCLTNQVSNPIPVQSTGLCNGSPTTCTLGFWKNHQAATTALLPQTLGGYPVNTWAKAQAILSAPACSKPIDCMAAQMLGVLLNISDGFPSSCMTTDLGQANSLLTALGYNGVGKYSNPSKAQKALATQLHDAFGTYNSDLANPC